MRCFSIRKMELELSVFYIKVFYKTMVGPGLLSGLSVELFMLVLIAVC